MKTPAFGYYMHDGRAAFSIELAGALAAEGAKKLEQDWRSASAVACLRRRSPHSETMSGSFLRDMLSIIGLLVLLIPASVSAQPLPIVQPTTPPESIAFARYIAWLNSRDPFSESGPLALAIVASLPGLDKQASLLVIGEVSESERREYGIIQLQGDSMVLERAIAPYFLAQRQTEDLPLSSVIITPRNYKFRYAGAVDAGDKAAHIFRITPKKNHAGLIRGELWIDPVTGAPVLVTGYLVKTPSTSIRSFHVASETTFVDGYPCARTTRMMIETRPVGRAELTIIESPDRDATPPSINGEAGRRDSMCAMRNLGGER